MAVDTISIQGIRHDEALDYGNESTVSYSSLPHHDFSPIRQDAGPPSSEYSISRATVAAPSMREEFRS